VGVAADGKAALCSAVSASKLSRGSVAVGGPGLCVLLPRRWHSGRHLSQWEALRVGSNTKFLSFVETSIQTSFPMTVKVNGVAHDGTTMYIHNKVHNRTRTLTCAGVSVH
jgi:hypothetical protein